MTYCTCGRRWCEARNACSYEITRTRQPSGQHVQAENGEMAEAAWVEGEGVWRGISPESWGTWGAPEAMFREFTATVRPEAVAHNLRFWMET